jgi:hypothetical protein
MQAMRTFTLNNALSASLTKADFSVNSVKAYPLATSVSASASVALTEMPLFTFMLA